MTIEQDWAASAGEWPAESRSALLDYWSSAAKREAVKDAYRDAAHLAHTVDPGYVVTPALQLIAANIEKVLRSPRRNLLVTTPPQEGKSTLCSVYTPLRALQLNPNGRIILTSYGDALAEDASRQCREIIESHGTGVIDPLTGTVVEDRLGYRLAPGSNKVSAWKLQGSRGGMIAVGWGASITGRAADLLIVDDPVKNMMEADSRNQRRKIWDWFASVARTRLSPQASMILIMCMTGDTRVLMADGAERELRYVRPGDSVATYENGSLSTSTVRNWANQGPDIVFAIRLKSGCVVRANARHPFLIRENGRDVWRRTDELRPGNKCLAVRGLELPAPLMNVTIRQGARACACPATTKHGGLQASDARHALAGHAGMFYSNSDMASITTNMIGDSSPRAVAALSVGAYRMNATSRNTGTATSVSITTKNQELSEGYYATIATSASGDSTTMPIGCAPPLTTWTITTNEIESIEVAGIEDVFDIQVDRTENFIANGLVSHNTRWHPEDLAGQIMAAEHERAAIFKTWKHINIPAISEEGISDALGREPGVAMESARGRTVAEFEATRRDVGDRVWYALYQGSPRNPAGGLFLRSWFEPHALPPENPVATIVGVDPADTGDADDTGILAAALDGNGVVTFTEDWSGKFTSDVWARRAVTLALTINAREIALEAYTTATTYVAVLKQAYAAIHADAVAKRHAGADLSEVELRALTEVPPFTIHKWRGRARIDAVGRSALLRQAFETRRARTVEHKLAVFEDHATDWQTGQHCPDRVAAAVIAHDRLAALSGGRLTVAAPINKRPDPITRILTPETSPWSRRLSV